MFLFVFLEYLHNDPRHTLHLHDVIRVKISLFLCLTNTLFVCLSASRSYFLTTNTETCDSIELFSRLITSLFASDHVSCSFCKYIFFHICGTTPQNSFFRVRKRLFWRLKTSFSIFLGCLYNMVLSVYEHVSLDFWKHLFVSWTRLFWRLKTSFSIFLAYLVNTALSVSEHVSLDFWKLLFQYFWSASRTT